MKNNRICLIFLILLMGLFINLTSSCNKKNITPAPTVELLSLYTLNVTITTDTSFVCGGNIMTDGGTAVTERGVCWALTENPTIENNKIALGNGIGKFTSTIYGIAASTTYYIRSYAISSKGITYGNQVQYATLKLPPRVYSISPTNVTSSSAVLGGNVIDDGGEEVVARGIFWTSNASIDPIVGTKVNSGTGKGAFTISLNGLVMNTKYYYRAFAINGSRWGYGDIKSFTLTQMPAADTTLYPLYLTPTSATIRASVNPNLIATDVYFEWGLTTAYGNTVKATPGSLKPPFQQDYTSYSANAQISGLTAYTLYHYRVKTVNVLGTVYGEDMPFYTQLIPGTLMQGGIVFYSDYKGHGLVCAPTDQSAAAPWWKNDGSQITDLGILQMNIGLGEIYTNSIVKAQGNGFYAAKICQDLVLNGYSDWFLPSRDELWSMQALDSKGIGNFKKGKYWSSSESMILSHMASIVDFSNGIATSEYKTNNCAVRAVRAF